MFYAFEGTILARRFDGEVLSAAMFKAESRHDSQLRLLVRACADRHRDNRNRAQQPEVRGDNQPAPIEEIIGLVQFRA
jgi:hypothetical protein